MSERAESIFNEARALPEREREAYLADACGGDETLHRRVAALLAADAEAGAFLDTVADPDATTSMAGGVPRSLGPGEAAGDVIGPYRLLQPLGEGGFGSVWMAEQKEPVRRMVALKIIKLGMDTKQVIARFEAERQALAMMDHSNIAKVFDAGSTETGRPYFVMELVKGVPIVEYCDRARLGGRERLELFILVCRAIQHAHQKGIIHRDIKPGNVLVTLHDGVPVPKVIDFGIAKATNQELTGRTLFTEFRQIVGTPAYMSPEQAEMSGLDIDTRSDIYSLGVLLYELLTGTTPFDAKTLLKRGYGEMMRVIREETPHKPSTRLSTLGEEATSAAEQRHTDVRRLGLMLRGDLDWIVMKCLEKDRTRRYETANGLAEDIARHLRSEPVTAGPPSAAYRARKFVKRNRAGVLAGGVLAATVLLGAIGTSVGLVWALRERDRADAAAESARLSEMQAIERAEQVERISRFQADQLSGIDVPRMGVGLLDSIRAEARSVGEQRGLTAGEIDRRQEELGNLLAGIDSTGLALASLRENIFAPAVDAIEAGFEDQPGVRATLLLTVSDTAWKLGAFDFALEPMEESVRVRTAAFGENDPRTLEAEINLAILTKDLGRFDEAERMWGSIIERSKAALGADHRMTIRAVLNHAVYLTAIGRYAEAEQGLREALAWYRANYGPLHEDTLGCANSLAVAIANQKRYAEAEPYYRACVEGYTQTLGPTARRTIITRNNFGTFYLLQDEFAKAEEIYRAAYQDARAGLGADHDNTLMLLDNLGNAINAQGRPEEAMEYARTAFESRRRVFGENHPATLRSYYNIASLQRKLGRLDLSEANFRRALEGFRLVYGEAHPNTSTAWTSLGGLLLQQKRYADVERAMLEEFRAIEPLTDDRAVTRRGRLTLALARFYAMWDEAEPGAGHDQERARWESRAAETDAGG